LIEILLIDIDTMPRLQAFFNIAHKYYFDKFSLSINHFQKYLSIKDFLDFNIDYLEWKKNLVAHI
jgi:hypothetical protein